MDDITKQPYAKWLEESIATIAGIDPCCICFAATNGPVGCKLHKDKEHQDVAATCGYCDDFHCFQSLVSVDREMQEGDGE